MGQRAGMSPEARWADGSRWSATFFTLENVDALFAKNRVTGECAGGLYFWASDKILVERLTESAIRETIDDLIRLDDFRRVLSRLDEA